ncbi:hypothetical protein OAK19_05885 [Aureispira]|nr:hypothetical protein [Aureispira sp.]
MPPKGVAVASPSLAPKQLISAPLKLEVMADDTLTDVAGSVIVTHSTELHSPVISVTVTQ